MRVEPDGSLDVAEQITFAYAGEFEGAYRDVPTRSGESIDRVSVAEGSTTWPSF